MIIDGDCHISPTDEYLEEKYSIKVDELLRRMDNAKVDKAIAWLNPSYLRETKKGNEYVYKATKKHPDRILGFGWVNPRLGIEEAKNTVKRCIYDYNLYGCKLNGAQDEFFIDDPKISLPIIEEVSKTGKIIAFHVGADAYEYTHPFRVSKIARLFPNTIILMVHMGGAAYKDLSHAAIEVAQNNDNVYLIGSSISTIPILNAIKKLGSSRVCFGSDTPFELMNVEVARYNAMLDNFITKKEKEQIMALNIAELLKLPL